MSLPVFVCPQISSGSLNVSLIPFPVYLNPHVFSIPCQIVVLFLRCALFCPRLYAACFVLSSLKISFFNCTWVF